MCWLPVQCVKFFFVIRNEDWTLENEPELCGFGHFCVYGMRHYQRHTSSKVTASKGTEKELDQTGSSLLTL